MNMIVQEENDRRWNGGEFWNEVYGAKNEEKIGRNGSENTSTNTTRQNKTKQNLVWKWNG